MADDDVLPPPPSSDEGNHQAYTDDFAQRQLANVSARRSRKLMARRRRAYRRSIHGLPVELSRRILLLLSPTDVPQLLLASRGVRRIFCPSKSELGFALAHINRHYVRNPKKDVDKDYDAYLFGIPFKSLPPVYALSILFSDRLSERYWRRRSAVTWITHNEFGSETMKKGPESTKARIERLFKTALALDWEVADATVALGGASMDKNLLLELLAEIAAAIDSLTALDMLLDLAIKKIPYDYVAKDDSGEGSRSSGGKQIPISDKPITDHHPDKTATPGIFHVALHFACKYGSEIIVRHLLDHFPAEFDHLMDRIRQLAFPEPLFYLAALTQNEEILEMLLKRHAQDKGVPEDSVNKSSLSSKPAPTFDPDVSAQHSLSNNSALHVVKFPDMVSMLLQHGADPNLEGIDGETPLHAACRRIACGCDVSSIAILLKNGADELKYSAILAAPLHYVVAARGGDGPFRVKAARLLLESGADPDQPNARGRSPLHYACKYENDEMIRLLLLHGADILLGDDDGCTPLDILRKRAVKTYFDDYSDSSEDAGLFD
ncbi:hypothetical protein HDU96_009385 [Phlyctochytrium bullatum]|nr:hypothetical protein HDU96_009385 [Phlyctochytrium bullatum]